MLLGVDVGGTFTDAVLAAPDGTLHTAKTPTTPEDESIGVLRAIELALDAAGAAPADVSAFAHGTTVTTNALLEGRCARTALVATEGFTDLIELGRQARAELYRLCAAHPPALVPPERRFAVAERSGPHGPLRAPVGLEELAERLAAAEVEAIAVVLLHASAHPAHELSVRDALRARLPEVHISLSHEVSGAPREYERGASTEIDAALSPLLRGYLASLSERSRQRGLPEPAVMQSSGGLTSAGEAAAHGAFTVLSGPAGGAQGARLAALGAGGADVLCFDMGGTSCDVCAIDGGEIRESDQRQIAGRPLALPTLDIETVGAGGGSIGWRDSGGALRVGPRSAGAQPGPAAYGRGGREPTVTDAHVVLGHLPATAALADGLALDREPALAAVTALAASSASIRCGRPRGSSRSPTPRCSRRCERSPSRAASIRAATRCSRSAAPARCTPLRPRRGARDRAHPLPAGLRRALGARARRRRAASRRDRFLRGGGGRARCANVRARELGAEPVRERVRYALRYRGQSFELSVDASPQAGERELRERFEAAHEREFGYRDDAGEVELVTVTVSVWGPAPALVAQPPRTRAVRGRTSDLARRHAARRAR